MSNKYNGGMVVGNIGKILNIPENYDDDFIEYAEDNNMVTIYKCEEADKNDTYFGFPVNDILVKDITANWIKDIAEKAAKFKKLTGIDAMLIGSQDVY